MKFHDNAGILEFLIKKLRTSEIHYHGVKSMSCLSTNPANVCESLRANVS